MNCDKSRYPNKKAAKKAAKALSNSSFGGFTAKFSQYHCKDCNNWHIYTSNFEQMKYNSQHARGGRGKTRRYRR